MKLERLNPNSSIPEIVEALQLRGESQKELFAAAKERRGDKVFVRGVIEPSNVCRQNCAYCGMQRDNKALVRFRISGEGLDGLVNQAVSIPEVDFVHIAMGEDPRFPFLDIAKQMKPINQAGKTASLVLGELPSKVYSNLYEASAGNPPRFTINLETTDPDFFGKIKPGYRFDNRLAKLDEIRKMGFQPCSGVIVGLPDQTVEMLAKDLLFLANYEGLVDISPSTFTPSPGSSFENSPLGDDTLTLNFAALTRLITKNPNLTITASSSLTDNAQRIALANFANQVSVHLLPPEYRNLYLIYNGGDRSFQEIDGLRKLVSDLGLRFNRT